MIVLDPGHRYQLEHLDGVGTEILSFVKRQGENYPGNTSHYEGTNLQEVLRALIDRIKYLDNQIPDYRNKNVLDYLRWSMLQLEYRAAERHSRDLVINQWQAIEDYPTCMFCKHIGCEGKCREEK